jgi:predicted alpha/beta-hydrolase family hydrolase
MSLHRLVTFIVMLLLFSGGSLADTRAITLQIKGTTALADLVVPINGSIKKGVLVITHGTQAHKDLELVDALQKALAERGIASLAHTLTLGINKRKGIYDCRKPHTHKHEDALDEIGAWLGWLKGQGAGPVMLLGHSRGGNQTAWYALERGGDVVKKIILMAPATGSSPNRAARSYQARYKADLDQIIQDAKALVSAGKPQEMMSLPGFLYCPDAKVQAGSIVSYYVEDPRRDTPSLLPKLKVPVLVIAGSGDSVVPDVVKRVKPLADGKKIKLEVIDGADHFFLDFYVEDAADLIAAFINPGS